MPPSHLTTRGLALNHIPAVVVIVLASVLASIVAVLFVYIIIKICCRTRPSAESREQAQQREPDGEAVVSILNKEGGGGNPSSFDLKREDSTSTNLHTRTNPPPAPERPVSPSRRRGGYHVPLLNPSFLFPARASNSGSVFREEGIWPPPRQESLFVDPLSHPLPEEFTQLVSTIMGAVDTDNLRLRMDSTFSGSSSTATVTSGPHAPATPSPSVAAVAAPAGVTRTPSRRSSSLSRGARTHAPRRLRLSASTPSLLVSEETDPHWPPTPGPSVSDPPPPAVVVGIVSPAWPVRPPTPGPSPLKGALAVAGPKRPATSDGSKAVANWLERTPKRPGTSPGLSSSF
ncbi:unnamed protein product [Mycena citricolor]|uniref:Uncharacterized protein n=1 Tax=Mycena citricolor TaxID=2018698 RepID=A0AAD2HL18_9AGAR|nr:unnamed protein product [Mycena citricolor]